MELETLAKKYNTNKEWHGYMSFYSKLFDPIKDSVSTFLEIGIDQGSSMLVWRDYFTKSKIYGIDINIPESVKNKDRLLYGVADQADSVQLTNLLNDWGKPEFDIILDDGGHCVKQQRVSIETLWPSLKSSGYYIIEDLHTNIEKIHSIHPHINKYPPFTNYIDETPTIHDKILNIMAGSTTEFSFPSSQIAEVLYFNTPNKLSLSCAFKKV